MTPFRRLSFRVLFLALLTLGFATLAAVPGQSEETPATAKQIADLEKEYQEAKQKADELKKKLDALRNGATQAPPGTEGG